MSRQSSDQYKTINGERVLWKRDTRTLEELRKASNIQSSKESLHTIIVYQPHTQIV